MSDTYEAFYNGKPLNPNRGLPTMSYAQAEDCGLTDSERLWCRTDGDGTVITADEVPYDSNNSVKDKIDSMATATVTGTLISGDRTVAYPQGFAYDNCIIIGFMIKINATRWDSFPNKNYPSDTLVSVRNDNIYVYNSNANLVGLDFKLTLMKI